MPHNPDTTVNPTIDHNISRLRPNRPASQPVSGVMMAAATMYALLPGMHTLALLALAFALLAVEALNTAIEVLCDHVTPDIHPAIKKAKDLGSAAIFIISCAIAVMFALALFHALHR